MVLVDVLVIPSILVFVELYHLSKVELSENIEFCSAVQTEDILL